MLTAPHQTPFIPSQPRSAPPPPLPLLAHSPFTMSIIDFPNPWAEPLPLPKDEMSLFLVLMPDRADSKRTEIRPTHLAHSAVGQETGWIVNGGPTFSSSDPSKMDGSWCLARGTSVEAIRERFQRDVYNVKGAWDWDKVTVRKCGALIQ